MSNQPTEHVLAEALEEYHRHRARGERPDEAVTRAKLGDLYPEFLELVAAETLIDRAIEPVGEESHLPMAWGAYTLLREIARGAAGVVYEAVHRKLGRKVALKILRTGIDTDETARERFQREAQALAQIKHDHIVEIYEFGEVDGRPFYAMTLIRGPTLADLVKLDKRPEPADLCRGLAGIADAMVTLHDAGIIHRDIKPSNIMIDHDGRYMLADFGLARSAMAETMTRSGDALGTPLYMSPEQILGDRKTIEARTDIYGLGATLYQLLTGTPPFKTESLEALMRMILRERPARPRQLDATLPEGSSRIAMTCLEKEPRDRYANAEALRDDLLACAQGARVSGRPLSPIQRGLRLIRKYPLVSTAAVVLIGFLIAMAVRPPPPAKLSFSTSVHATASLDGGARTATPIVKRPLVPGRVYEVVIYPDDPTTYYDKKFSVDAESNEHLNLLELSLEAIKGARNPAMLTELRNNANIKLQDAEVPGSGERSAGKWEATFPRGKVRIADVADWHIVFEESEGGSLEFRIDGEVVATVPLVSDEYPLHGPLPTALLRLLEPGVEVNWAILDASGKKLVAEAAFVVVDVDMAAQFKTIDALLAEWRNEANRKEATRVLQAEALLQRGLAYAAWTVIQAPYEQRVRELRSQVAPAVEAADKPERAATKIYDELARKTPPRDPKARATHEQALKAASVEVDRLQGIRDAAYRPLTDYEDDPKALRSLPILALQQLAIERLFAANPLTSSLWEKHQTWREMFSDDEWTQHYQR